MAEHHGAHVILGPLECGSCDDYRKANALHVVVDWDYRNDRLQKKINLTPVDRVNVHPDSANIFHPRENDVVRMGANRVRVFSAVGFTEAQAALYAQEVTEIIERDGKRFFWPLIEEAV